MPNSENLKPINTRTKREQRKIAQKGGKKSGEARREKKKLRELLEMALEMTDPATGLTNEMAITHALIKQAKKGNVVAYITIRDTKGEKPIDKQEITVDKPVIIDDIDG